MADYYTNAVVQPFIPSHLLSEEDLTLLRGFGFSIDIDKNDLIYLFADEYSGTAYIECDDGTWQEREEDELVASLQKIIVASGGEVPMISIEFSYTCSKPRPDGFGGSAWFITAEGIEFISTQQWIVDRVSAFEEKNKE